LSRLSQLGSTQPEGCDLTGSSHTAAATRAIVGEIVSVLRRAVGSPRIRQTNHVRQVARLEFDTECMCKHVWHVYVFCLIRFRQAQLSTLHEVPISGNRPTPIERE
jgi:hypothetical protein